MEEIIVKKEEPDMSFAMASLKERSWRKQDQAHLSRLSLPAKITITGKGSTLAPPNPNSTPIQRQRLLPGHSAVTAGPKQKPAAAASSYNAYSLGTRCGEIFVVNNAKQWTFVCTFCNKSTRDIGDFICHIKIKHLEESNLPPQQYKNEFYGDDADDDEDDDASAQAQDVSNYFRHNRRAIEIIPINREVPKRSSFKISTPSTEQRRVERTSSEYLDCGSYLDINVHTDPEELNYSNGDKYGVKYEAQHQQYAAKIQNRSNDNNWLAPRQQKQKDQQQQLQQQQHQQQHHHSKHKHEQEQKRQNNVVQILDDSDNDIEDILETHTSHRQQTKHREQLQQQQQLYRAPENTKQRNGANDASLGSTMDIDDEDAPPDYMAQNDTDDYVDDDFDNQLLLAPTDSIESSTPSSDGKIKRRQIRGTAYCALCNKTFQYYSLYRNHMIKHSNETPFKCNICQKGFKSKQAIRYHMNTHQKETKFKCEICETGFYTENQFITHVLTHENANTYPCMVCGKVLHSEKERDLHLTTHNEERPFRCEFCQKLFRLRHHLSNHLKMHRQYRCEYCREEFSSAVHLRKPYACPVCENSPEARSANENALQHVNPMQLFEAVMPPTQPTECVDLAEMVSDSDDVEDEEDDQQEEEEEEEEDEEEDDMGEPSSSRSSTNKKKPFPCKHCPRAYSHLSGLNYHIRTKH